MSKDAYADWDTDPDNNTDIGGTSIAEGCAMANLNNAIRIMMAQLKTEGFVSSGSAVALADNLFTITDNGDATKVAAFQASGISTATTRTYTFPDASGTLALVATSAQLGTEDQVVAGGARVTPKDLGTASSGTVTPDPGDRPIQYYINGGAHTLAPGSNKGSYLLEITNNGSAGAVTTSGFTYVSGSFTTTNGHKFLCSVVVSQTYSFLGIQALQ